MARVADVRNLVRDWAAVLEVLSPPVVDRADAAAAAISGYLADLAAHRRIYPADDLISALAGAADGDTLTQDELVTMAALLLAAGFGTTTGLLANGLLALSPIPAKPGGCAPRPGSPPRRWRNCCAMTHPRS